MDPQDFLDELPYLRRVARRLLADPLGAEDLVQEAWLQFRRRPPERTRGLRPWLRAVLRNLSLERRRADSRRLEQELFALERDDSRTDPPHDELTQKEVASLLVREIEGLDETYRSILRLRFYHDLTSPEIATREGLPESTVRTRIRRGLLLLRAALETQGGKDRWMHSLLILAAGEQPPLATPGRSAHPHWIRAASGAAVLATAAGVGAWLGLWGSGPERAGVPPSQAAASEPRESVGPDLARPGPRIALSASQNTAELRVQVRLEPSGTALEGATITVFAGDEALASATTDESGATVLVLPAGRPLELVIERTAGHAGARRSIAPFSSGHTLTVEVRELCDVHGRVERSSPGPLEGHLVRALDGPYPSFLDGGPPVFLAETRTDREGGFSLSGIPVDAALLATSDDGLLFGLYGARATRGSGRVDWAADPARAPAEFLSAEREPVVRMVQVADVSVRVLGSDGAPLEGAQVSLIGTGFTDRTSTTDADGRTTQTWLVAQRTLALGVSAPGHASEVHGCFALSPDAPEYELSLERERPIRGRVEDRDGIALSGVTLLVSRPEPNGSPVASVPETPLPERLLRRVHEPVRSGPGGEFTLLQVGSGPYDIEAWLGNRRIASAVARGGDDRVVLRESSDAGRVFGRVVDATTGAPLSDVLVCAEPLETDHRWGRANGARFGAAGFELPLHSSSRWVLYAEADGYAPFSTAPRVLERGDYRIDIGLQPARRVQYRIEDANGTPGSDLWVVAVRREAEQGFAGATGSTDAHGELVLGTLPADGHIAFVWAPYSTTPFRFEVLGHEREPRLRLPHSWTEPRTDRAWELVNAQTGERLFHEVIPDFTLTAFDSSTTSVLLIRWTAPLGGAIAHRKFNLRRPSIRSDGGVVVTGSDTPSPWWWLGSGPLFSDGDRAVLPPLPLPSDRVRFLVEAAGYETIERWIDLAATPPDEPLHFELVPLPAELR